MGFRTRVEMRGDELVVVKRAQSQADRAALAAEAATLEALSHPGVVVAVSFDVGDTTSELVIAHAGSMNLSDYTPGSEAAAARLGASVAATVADLHAAGLCHGGLTPDHVIVGSAGETTLCSLRRAVAVGDEEVEADLAALRAIVGGLVERCPAARGRLARRQRQALRAATDSTAAGLRTAAQFAAALAAVPGAQGGPFGPGPGQALTVAHGAGGHIGGTAGHRGTDRQQGRAHEVPLVAESGPDARTWRDRVEPLPKETAPGPWRRRGSTAGVVVAGCIVAAALVWAALVGNGPGPGAQQITAPPTVPDLTSAEAATSATEEATPATPPSTSSPVCHATPAPVGCHDDVEVVGRFVRAGEAWFELGADTGDQVLIGDWDCDGMQTPAVLRPRTGQVFLFGEWAARGTALDAPVAALATPGGRGKVVERQGCDDLINITDVGVEEWVPLP